MRPVDLARLLALASIWGGSFIFMRILAPVLGPILTADSRVLIAGFALLLYFRVARIDPQIGRFWKQYTVIGLVNSALPFLLYAFAALHIDASYSVTVNASSPLFGALFSAIWLRERLAGRKLAGLVIGGAGVALVSGLGAKEGGPLFGWAVAACILAAACYGISGVYMKLFAGETEPVAVAGMSQLVAGVALLPLVPLQPLRGSLTTQVVWLAIAFALLCSALAYLLYFRLMADIGPTRTLTVTFLMPAFGIVWGVTLLGESLTLPVVAGCGLIVLGTMLVLLQRRQAPEPPAGDGYP